MKAAILVFGLALSAFGVEYDIADGVVAETVGADVREYLTRRTLAGTFTVGGLVPTTVHVGDTDFAKAKGLGSETLKDEEWVIRSFGGDIVLNGRGRGLTLAAVHFLDDDCGVRWWSEYEEYVPTGDLRLPALNRRGRPAFPVRNVYSTPRRRPNEAAFQARTLLNGRGDANYGPVVGWGSPRGNHTAEHYLPREQYFGDHPDWFAFSKSRGRRVHTQPCLSNPEVRVHFKKRLREYIEKDRAAWAGRPGAPYIYDISQNDNLEYCECPACAEAIEKKGCSGLYLDFVNDIASSVTNDYPNVLVSTFAYQWSAEPPKDGTCAADNVIVRFCNTMSSIVGSIRDPENPYLLKTLKGWSAHAKRLAVWDYAINYGRRSQGFPIPGEFGFADRFKAFRDHGVVSVYIEHENQHLSDMWELKYRLETKLMDDPDADADRIIADFMHEYYGAAGDNVLAYRRLIWEARRRKGTFMRWIPPTDAFDFMTEDVIAESERLFDAAEEKVKGDATRLARVRHARLGLDLLMVCRERLSGGEETPRTRAARKRANEDWMRWMRRYPRGDGKWMDRARAENLGVPPPEKFKGRRSVDFPALMLRARGGSGCDIVPDPTTPVGYSLKLPWDYCQDEGLALPFDIGMHLFTSKRTILTKSFEKPLGEGWQWYHLGCGRVSQDTRIWVTRSWGIFLPCMYYNELWDKDYDVWISAKLTGPKYGLASKDGTSDIWVDRMVLVEPGKLEASE